MHRFETVRGKVVPLPLKDVDTDMIIPAQYLTRTTKEGFSEGLFRRLRDNNPEFCLNQNRYAGAEILLAGSNFGCGSSREHAVWALQGAGFKVVIAKSFADIFSGNSAKNGLLLVVLPEFTVDKMLAEAEAGELWLRVDLAQQCVTSDAGDSHCFQFDPFRKHCILNGLDDLDFILTRRDEILAFRENQESNRFYRTTAINNSSK